MILDLGLPDLDGTEVIAGLRGWTSVPIIVLSARVDSADKVRALDAGADDYMTKPFGMAELLARLRAAVRRAATDVGENQGVVNLGSIRIDLAAKLVSRGGSDVHLTPTEWGILEVLLKHRGKLVTQRELLRPSGARSTRTTATTCGCTSRNCGARSRTTRPARST